jgi:hypothetical protein
MTRRHPDKDSVMAPAQLAMDITPHATNELTYITRFIMVSEDNATVTGYLEGDENVHTTVPLKAGAVYPFAFKRITAVSSGNVKGYA